MDAGTRRADTQLAHAENDNHHWLAGPACRDRLALAQQIAVWAIARRHRHRSRKFSLLFPAGDDDCPQRNGVSDSLVSAKIADDSSFRHQPPKLTLASRLERESACDIASSSVIVPAL